MFHPGRPRTRRKSTQIYVGKVPVGGDAPIAVQSMTNTITTDVGKTAAQVQALQSAGADIVRIAVNTSAAADALPHIQRAVPKVPLVADIHFDYRIAIQVLTQGIDCVRINPGNIGNINRIRQVVLAAKARQTPIRIGVNAGSLERDLQSKYGEPTPEALVESALRHINYLMRFNYANFKVSVKASDPLFAVEAYRLLAREIEQPLHLGVTEAGGVRAGSIKSAVALGILLSEGIGDTVRISLAADPVEEIKVAYDLLKALRLRARGINFIACPTCARQEIDVIQTVQALEQRLGDVLTPLDVSVIGCVVNGPGEAKCADIGVVGGRKTSAYYIGGERCPDRLGNETLIDELEAKIRSQLAKQKLESPVSSKR